MYTTIIGVISFNHAGGSPNQVHSVSQVLLTKEVPCGIKVPKEGAYLVLGNYLNIEFSDLALKDIKSLYPKLLEQISNKMYMPQEVEGYGEILLEIDFEQNIAGIQDQITKANTKRHILKQFLNHAHRNKIGIAIKYWGKEKIEEEYNSQVRQKIDQDDYVSVSTLFSHCEHIDLVDIINVKYV